MKRPEALRLRAFVLTYVSYASYYFCRKQFAVAKSTLADTFHLSLSTLGAIDTGYLVAYAAGLFASGLIADAVSTRRLLGYGMLAAAASTAAFGLGSTGGVFAVAFTLDGLFQSTGWPGTVKVMNAWCGPDERGRIMGRWSTCYQVGGVAATAAATHLLATFGWRSAFFVPAAWTGAVGVLLLLALVEKPPAATSATQNVADVSDVAVQQKNSRALEVLAEPLLWLLGASYFCLKLMRYGLLFWLPFFLHKQLGYSTSASGYLSLSFEIGGAFGAVAVGQWSDRVGRGRGVLLVGMTLALAGACVLYGHVAAVSWIANFLSMALVGFALFGPDALVCSVAAMELGGAEGAGLAAGVINGIGSVGAIAQGLLVSVVAARWGWSAVFRVFVLLALGCAVLLVPYALASLRRPADVR